ncbi:MAG: hypothetical protein K5908_07070, partial [Erysipelotrichaceae bacterium]|nr:hypothetical protein [Erysipelotrichaceae bacterium]
MLLVGPFLFPFDSMTFHDSGELFFFRLSPLTPFRLRTGASFESLSCQSLFQRNPGVQTSFTSGDERNEID